MNYLNKCGFFLFCIFAFTATFLQGCGDDDDTSATLSISNKKLTFTQNAATKDLTIYTSSKWNAKSNASWLSVSPGSSSESSATITVQASANTETGSRSGYLAFSNSDGKRDTINVLQTGTNPMIAISKESASIAQSGGSVNVLVASNIGDWEISSDARWIKLPSVTSSTNNCTFTIVANAYEGRTGTVSFKQGGTVYAELKIEQSEATTDLERGADSMALVRFYEVLLGDQWTRKWDLTTPITSWPGVTVVDGRVVGISLNNNKLEGAIPAGIANLTELQSVSLEGNLLSGNLPSGLSSLTKLESLNLSKNSFAGTMPTVLQQITSLKSLNLSYNNYTNFIDFSALTNLEELTISDNSSLAVVLPKTIAKLTKITKLDLSNNALTGTIPEELKQLTNLTELKLGFNQLSGSIPSGLSSLTKLTSLDLQENSLSGAIPSSVGELKELKSLLLNGNQLSGTIPSSIGNLTNLETLLMHENALTGTIPTELGNLKNLKVLFLNDNDLSGAIPGELANITTLKTLNLSDNRLSKPVPDAILEMESSSFFNLCNQKDNVNICE